MRTAIDYALEAKDLREKLRDVRAERDALRAALARQVPEALRATPTAPAPKEKPLAARYPPHPCRHRQITQN